MINIPQLSPDESFRLTLNKRFKYVVCVTKDCLWLVDLTQFKVVL